MGYRYISYQDAWKCGYTDSDTCTKFRYLIKGQEEIEKKLNEMSHNVHVMNIAILIGVALVVLKLYLPGICKFFKKCCADGKPKHTNPEVMKTAPQNQCLERVVPDNSRNHGQL